MTVCGLSVSRAFLVLLESVCCTTTFDNSVLGLWPVSRVARFAARPAPAFLSSFFVPFGAQEVTSTNALVASIRFLSFPKSLFYIINH